MRQSGATRIRYKTTDFSPRFNIHVLSRGSCFVRVNSFRSDCRPTGSYPQTDLAEINSDVLEADFGTTSSESALNATSGLPVIRELSVSSDCHPAITFHEPMFYVSVVRASTSRRSQGGSRERKGFTSGKGPSLRKV